ncbi:MAG: adenosylcobinamide-GDP ribazoletransferase, partial [Kangiellaceae bacterium]|nr:adenosylcobinamide-GDP ribazoletransferase [Kangiellaceae bacterium]
GSFHEDGLADTCDGFGGGWTKQRKLEIMKDSRLGTYGAVAIWFTLTLKLICLFSLAAMGFELVLLGLLVAHPLSRSVATCMIFFLPYVTGEENAKIKPLAEKSDRLDFSVSLAIGLFALFLVTNIALAIVITLVITYLLLAGLFKKQIGGFTGDTLGATQQISEIVIYLVLIANSSMIDGLWLEGITP